MWIYLDGQNKFFNIKYSKFITIENINKRFYIDPHLGGVKNLIGPISSYERAESLIHEIINHIENGMKIFRITIREAEIL